MTETSIKTETADPKILTGINVLAAVVRTSSFIRAAQDLGLTQPAVSHAIARLEARLGIRLLHRTTRAVSLTDEGHVFFAQVEPLLAGIDDAVSALTGASTAVRGTLRINMDPFFSRLLLAPRLGTFLDRYPDLSLELITRDSLGDLVKDGFDLAIRFGEPQSSSLVARKLLDTRILTVASPAYLARHGRPAKPKDLTTHNCIQFRDPMTSRPFAWEFHRGKRILPVATKGRLLLTEVGTMLNACMAGVGIAQVMAFGMEGLIRDGRLIDLFPDWPDERFPLYALYPSRALLPARHRVFLEFILRLTRPARKP